MVLNLITKQKELFVSWNLDACALGRILYIVLNFLGEPLVHLGSERDLGLRLRVLSQSEDQGKVSKTLGGWLFSQLLQEKHTRDHPSFHPRLLALFTLFTVLQPHPSLIRTAGLIHASWPLYLWFSLRCSFLRSLHDEFLHIIQDTTQMAVPQKGLLGPSSCSVTSWSLSGPLHPVLFLFFLYSAYNLLYVFFLKPVYCLSSPYAHVSTCVWFMWYSQAEYLT